MNAGGKGPDSEPDKAVIFAAVHFRDQKPSLDRILFQRFHKLYK
jgi:hypothetical protein